MLSFLFSKLNASHSKLNPLDIGLKFTSISIPCKLSDINAWLSIENDNHYKNDLIKTNHKNNIIIINNSYNEIMSDNTKFLDIFNTCCFDVLMYNYMYQDLSTYIVDDHSLEVNHSNNMHDDDENDENDCKCQETSLSNISMLNNLEHVYQYTTNVLEYKNIFLCGIKEGCSIIFDFMIHHPSLVKNKLIMIDPYTSILPFSKYDLNRRLVLYQGTLIVNNTLVINIPLLLIQSKKKNNVKIENVFDDMDMLYIKNTYFNVTYDNIIDIKNYLLIK